MEKLAVDADSILKRATPLAHQQAHEIQPFGHLARIVSDVIGQNELQVWFVAAHVVEVSLTHAV